MQKQKEEIRNKILECAKSEFLKNGYEKASIRKIVAAAETNIGNFYNYFPGKEELFSAIVENTKTVVIRFIKDRKAEEEDASIFEAIDKTNARKVVSQAINLFSEEFMQNLILLTECSQGTKYENFSDDLTEYVRAHFLDHKNIINPDYPDDGVSILLSKQFLSGVLSVIKKDIPNSQKIDLITEYLLFFTYGTFGLLKK